MMIKDMSKLITESLQRLLKHIDLLTQKDRLHDLCHDKQLSALKTTGNTRFIVVWKVVLSANGIGTKAMQL